MPAVASQSCSLLSGFLGSKCATDSVLRFNGCSDGSHYLTLKHGEKPSETAHMCFVDDQVLQMKVWRLHALVPRHPPDSHPSLTFGGIIATSTAHKVEVFFWLAPAFYWPRSTHLPTCAFKQAWLGTPTKSQLQPNHSQYAALKPSASNQPTN